MYLYPSRTRGPFAGGASRSIVPVLAFIAIVLFLGMIGAARTRAAGNNLMDYCAAKLPSDRWFSNPPAGQLLMVQLLTRHGDRTPLTRLPNDRSVWNCTETSLSIYDWSQDPTASPGRLFRQVFANGEYLPGNCNFGQLTQLGSAQHVELGEVLRQIYVDHYGFLQPQLNTSDVWVRSTDIYRTIQSAQSLLAGMFPPNNSGPAQVVNFITHDLQVETMFPNTGLCPRLQQLINTAMQSPEFQAKQALLVPLQNAFQKAFNVSAPNMPPLDGVLDALRARLCHDMKLPDGVTMDMVQQLAEIEDWMFSYLNAPQPIARLGIGMLVREMYLNMANYLNAGTGPRFRLYSGHDTSVGPFLAALQADLGDYPPYRAHVALELWQTDNGPVVRLLAEDGPRAMGACGELCGWCDFQELVAPVMPTDFDSECVAQ